LRVAPVALVVSSKLTRAVRQARHSQNAWARHVERVLKTVLENLCGILLTCLPHRVEE